MITWISEIYKTKKFRFSLTYSHIGISMSYDEKHIEILLVIFILEFGEYMEIS